MLQARYLLFVYEGVPAFRDLFFYRDVVLETHHRQHTYYSEYGQACRRNNQIFVLQLVNVIEEEHIEGDELVEHNDERGVVRQVQRPEVDLARLFTVVPHPVEEADELW